MSTIPRLLLVLTEFPPRVGGMQTHAAYLARHLAANGYDIEVFTHRVNMPAMIDEAQAFDRDQPFVIHRVLGRLSYQHNLQIVAQHARRFQPDIIYSSTVFYGILQSRLGIPVVCRCVGNDLMRPWLGYPYRFGSRFLNLARLEKWLHAWIEKEWYPDWVEALFRRKREWAAAEAARAASCIFANSDFTAGLLRNLQVGDARIATLVGGVDCERFRHADTDKASLRRALELPESGFLLMTACRLVRKKGIDLLLEALPALSEIYPGMHLVVVGDGKYKSRYQDYCIERGIGNITFAGSVPHQHIHSYYAASDLFVLASRESVNPVTGARDVETMGRVLCEANAAGLPVIASRSGGIPSVIDDGRNGLLFEAENMHEFIECVRFVIDHPEAMTGMVHHGLARARDEFDWLTILQEHERVFARLVDRTVTSTGAAEYVEAGRLLVE